MCKSCYQAHCREVNKEKNKKYQESYRAEHKEEQREYDKARWEKADKEAARQKAQRWREENVESSRQQKREYVVRNRSRLRAKRVEWVKLNKQQQKKYFADYYLANKDNKAELMNLWRQNNPEKVKVIRHRRRVLVENGSDLTYEEWQSILDSAQGCCAYCGTSDLPLTMDHMVPLFKGGRHTASNVIPACKPCNSKKHTMTYDEFVAYLKEL